MSGGKGNIHNHPNANTNGFDKRPEDAKKGGRKPSIRKQLEELLQEDGTITFSSKQVQEIKDDGSVVLKLPTQMQMAMKLVSWAMSKKGNDSIRAIQMIMEQVDGKPKQSMEVDIPQLPKMTKEEKEARLKELLDKANESN